MAVFLGALTALLIDPLTWLTVIFASIIFHSQKFLFRLVVSSAVGIVTNIAIAEMVESIFLLPRLVAPVIIALVVNFIVLKWKKKDSK
jgi:hypothetical protein